MLEGQHIYSLISPITGSFAFMIGVYVMTKNPFLPASRFFAFLMSLFLVAGFLDFLFMTVEDEATAKILARLVIFILVIIYGGFLYISSFLISGSRWRRIFYPSYRFIILLLIFASIPAMLVSELLMTDMGWSIPDSPAEYSLIIILAGYASAALIILADVYKHSKDSKLRTQVILLATGIASPLLWALCLAVMELFDSDLPSILSPGFLIASLFFMICVVRQKLFVISPERERGALIQIANEPAQSIYEKLSPPVCLVIESKNSSIAYGAFIDQISKGRKGILVTRYHPELISQKYGIHNTPIIWLAAQPGADRIDPSNLSVLQHTIVEFLRKGENAVVMIDGVEYLVSNNTPEKVLRVLLSIKDEVITAKSILIIPIDPETIETRYLSILEKEFECTRLYGAGTEI